MLVINPLFGDILADTDPELILNDSNDKFAILIFVKPLPSPKNAEPLATIILPLDNIEPLTVNEPE